jgi:MarR family transcriptional regulator, organic hydroperoxide resistance regulator
MSKFYVINTKKAQELPGVLLWHASKLWQHHLAAAVSDLGLSSTNAVILCNALHLSAEGKPATQAMIAQLSGVDIMTTSTALRVLEKKGYIVRYQGRLDRRAREVQLTTSGEAAALTALKRIALAHVDFFKVLDSNGSQQLVRHLQKIISENSKSKG